MRNSLFLCLLKKLTIRAGLPIVLFAHSTAVAATTPKYVQGNYAVPQTSQTAVTVPYTAGQTAGNLNVVIVGWNDSAAHITSLKDSKGNAYQLVVGPMVTGAISQSVYYAKNIAAAAAATNAVTITFSTPATAADVRVLEYSGVDPISPVDTFTGATGDSGTSSSGAVKTTNATDLIVAANTVQSSTIVASSGFTSRLLTTPDGDIVEDTIVTVTGTYAASAPLTEAAGWVMQTVAFRGASVPTPTPTPKPTPTPTLAAAVATPTPTAIAYVQGNYVVPQTKETSVTVPYTAAQTAGDLNVVIVGWSDSTAHVSSVTDSNKNVYQLAIGPTVVTGSIAQSIYYAKNIFSAKAGANAVTLTFSTAANYPDVRILEYKGINTVTPLDVSVGSTGSSGTSNSGAVTTKNANDLLIAANTVLTATAGAGTGFTQRLLTNPDGDVAEDQIVKAIASYSASVTLKTAGVWVAQMVGFRAASSTSTPGPTPTPAPTPTPKPMPTPTLTPKPTATPTSTPNQSATPTPKPASSVTLAWNADAATSNPATNTVGYRLHMGTASGVYTQTTDLRKATTATVSNLQSGTTHYFVVTAYNSVGLDSPPSAQLVFVAP
jgi:hypothetical protein